MDALALIVFIAALAVSSAHIITHMGLLATSSYDPTTRAGIVLSIGDYTVVHQIAMILLAEASMLLFMIIHGMSAKEREQRHWILRLLSLPFVLALIAATFVFVANWQSGIGLLESLMPPVFTVGIGLHLEHLIVAGLQRREDIDSRYLAALEVYESATEDPTKHPEYIPMLRQEIWQRLLGLPANRDFRDAPHWLKHAAVRRELERDQWAYRETLEQSADDWQPERPTSALPKGRKANSGSILPVLDGEKSTSTMLHANGHGTDATIPSESGGVDQ